MSIQAIIDTCIHIHSFRNIDLIEQGIYMVCITIPQSHIYSLERCHMREPDSDKHRLIPAQISETSFYSRGFLLMYAEEEATINDLAIFRSEFNSLAKNKSFSITVDLLFSPAMNIDSNHEFVLAKSQEVLINRPLDGANQFISVTFTEGFTSQVNLCVHTFLLDYRYRFKDNSIGETDITSLLSSLMFPQKKIVSSQDKDKAYAKWVKKLAAIYEKNRKLLERIDKSIDANICLLYTSPSPRDS